MNTQPEPAPVEQGDLLYGVPAIAAYLNLRDQQVYHLAAAGRLPTFRIGSRKICARKSSLTAWLDEQEAATGTPVPGR